MRKTATAAAPGTLIISLDFELHWGCRDLRQVDEYRHELLRAREEIPHLLEFFHAHDIHATWATVGFLFAKSRDELLAIWPEYRPQYKNIRLSPYVDISAIGEGEADDPCHYALSLIRCIASYPTQEIATHTLSHYYCWEDGQDCETFCCDLRAALALAKSNGLEITTLVFPRNQCNADYLAVCRQCGITAYRGNEGGWLYSGCKRSVPALLAKIGRLCDAYLNLTGHHCFALEKIGAEMPVNIPSSRLLRAYPRLIRCFEPLRLRRVLAGMTFAARHGLAYHLWLHPEVLGRDTARQWVFLQAIIAHYEFLRASEGMRCRNIREMARVMCAQPTSAEDTEAVPANKRSSSGNSTQVINSLLT